MKAPAQNRRPSFMQQLITKRFFCPESPSVIDYKLLASFLDTLEKYTSTMIAL